MENNKLRPMFHINPGDGWMNDPNGLIKFNGMYHAFFQYYPNDVYWGPMHWGHRVSEDLIHWTELPPALYPKTCSNEDGCFSGTAMVHDGVLYLAYTGHFDNGGGENIRQVQCLASSKDGVNFQKHGIIIDESKLPSNISPCDFRDPKIWEENGVFYMIVAAREKEGRGHILLFKSKDIFNWEYVSDLLGRESKGSMIECPDFVPKLNLLIHSEQFQPAEGYKHLNISTTRYVVGEMDYNENKFNELYTDIVDYGFDFYAPQTFANENILMGWLNMWDRNLPCREYGFAGQLTIPRLISIVDGKLLQTPVWDYSNQVVAKVDGHLDDKLKHGAIKFNIKDLESFELVLRQKDDQYFKVYLNGDHLVFDRSHMLNQVYGAEKDQDSLNFIRRMPVYDLSDVTFEVIMDEFSLEFFVNGLSASFQVFNDIDADNIKLTIQASDCEYIKSLFR